MSEILILLRFYKHVPFRWVGLGWVGLGWAGFSLGWAGLGWVGLKVLIRFAIEFPCV